MMITLIAKKCSRCRVPKEASGFNKDSRAKDGLASKCNLCRSVDGAKYRLENPEKVKASQAKYLMENPEKAKASRAKYRMENPEKIKSAIDKYRLENSDKIKVTQAKWMLKNSDKMKAYSDKYYFDNSEKVKASSAKYRLENADKVRAAIAKWRIENPEKINVYMSKWHKDNKILVSSYYHARRARLKGAGGSYSKEDWIEILNSWGHKCASCRCSGPMAVDHIISINMGGNNSRDNLQPLCKSCNSSKGAKSYSFIKPRSKGE